MSEFDPAGPLTYSETKDSDWCPSVDECHDMFLSLQPRGEAFQTSDWGGTPTAGSVLKSFWLAIATIWQEWEQAICDSLLEWSCSTASEDLDLWRGDYFGDDECDPFVDLCSKVRRLGILDFFELNQLAAVAGWDATFQYVRGNAQLYVRLRLATSAAVLAISRLGQSFVLGGGPGGSTLGVTLVGGTPTADAFERFSCFVDRLAPAHIAVLVEIID